MLQEAVVAPLSKNLSETELRQREKLTRELGPLVIGALNDPMTIEIMLNPDGRLWVEKLGEDMKCIGTMAAEKAEAALNTIAACLRVTVTRENPILEGELPLDGSRFEGLIPPVVAAPTFAIRRKASSVFTLDQYVESGSITAQQRAAISNAVRARKNILVVGGTSSGKTTLTNALIDEINSVHPQHRILIIEDTGEIQCNAENAVVMRASASTDMLKLLKATMRLRPDRILIGEVRGGESFQLLKYWISGHPGGIATLHADDPATALLRLEQLVSEATLAPMQGLIGQAVDLVVHIAKTAGGRKVQGVLEVSGYENGKYITTEICNTI